MGTLADALSFVGVSLVVDSVMPATMGNAWEDIIRGFCVLLLLHAVVGYISRSGSDVESFANWLTARSISNTLVPYGRPAMSVLVCVCLAFVSLLEKRTGSSVMRILYNLLVLVATFLLTSWVISIASPPGGGDQASCLVFTKFRLFDTDPRPPFLARHHLQDPGYIIVFLLCTLSILRMALVIYA